MFYEKIKVPAPTWCPECRMVRRFMFYNQHMLFRKKDEISGKELFSHIPPSSPVKIYEHDYWWSGHWDPMVYGREYEFSRPFLAQFHELLYAVPWPSQNATQLINSDYCDHAGFLKNCYLCFDIGNSENCAYVIRGDGVTESVDLYEARHTVLSYENYMSDEAYRVLFSVNCEECTEVWFSKNLLGCSHCFGCVNLRNKSYYIFNKPYTKEAYLAFISEFNSGSYWTVQETRKRAQEFWIKFPMRFTLAIRVENSTGEHIEKSRNLKFCYSVHGSENLSYCQFIDPPATDSYDCSSGFYGLSSSCDTLITGQESYGLRFGWMCWPSNHDLEYSVLCRSSSYLFGCVGLDKKQYCIFNKQYSKENYFALREKVIEHMNSMPYTDKQGRVYRYGEFFPPEFSPFAYNETITQDFFPLTKDEAIARGYVWRDPETREYRTTIDAKDLPDHIKDINDAVLKEIIKCLFCGKAYRIIQMEFDFLRRMSLPLPRLCPNCRYLERIKHRNPPKFYHRRCTCRGTASENGVYENQTSHFHGSTSCPNEFETSFAPDRSEIVYCEQCYNVEVA